MRQSSPVQENMYKKMSHTRKEERMNNNYIRNKDKLGGKSIKRKELMNIYEMKYVQSWSATAAEPPRRCFFYVSVAIKLVL